MRQGQQSRRSRNRGRKPQNPISRNYESSGPDVKIRGTAMHIAEKYASLARDAMASGDNVAAENYLQHAEHYNRIVMAAQAQNAAAFGAQEAVNGYNGGGRFGMNEPFQRELEGSAEDGEMDDFSPQPQQHERLPRFLERGRDRGGQERNFDRQHDRSQERAPNYHQQPQPYIPHAAFPQLQPQPQPAAPNANGGAPQPEGQGPMSGEGERRRRRRRPMGDSAKAGFEPRGAAAPANGATPGEDQGPDDVAI